MGIKAVCDLTAGLLVDACAMRANGITVTVYDELMDIAPNTFPSQDSINFKQLTDPQFAFFLDYPWQLIDA